MCISAHETAPHLLLVDRFRQEHLDVHLRLQSVCARPLRAPTRTFLCRNVTIRHVLTDPHHYRLVRIDQGPGAVGAPLLCAAPLPVADLDELQRHSRRCVRHDEPERRSGVIERIPQQGRKAPLGELAQ